jgi:uncharacterized membrane protein
MTSFIYKFLFSVFGLEAVAGMLTVILSAALVIVILVAVWAAVAVFIKLVIAVMCWLMEKIDKI